MKCSLDGGNAKILAKAIQSLSKFGTDLFVEADKEGLQFRALNASRSAVGSFKFHKSFFESYHMNGGSENYCKVAMKACLGAFRSMKQVEHCELRIMPEQAKFQIQLKCHLETIKNALISIVDEENVTTAVFPDNTSNIITGSHKIFTEIANNFHATEEELTLEAQNAFLAAKNYVEGARVNERFVRSQLKLASGEFDVYKIDMETSITFCLKELKAFLLFAEAINENMTLHFEEGGSPVLLKIKKFDELECTLVMSTLSPDDVSFCEDNQRTEASEAALNGSMATKRKSQNTTAAQKQPKTRKVAAAQATEDSNSTLFQFNGNGNNAPDEDMLLVEEMRSLEAMRSVEAARLASIPNMPSNTSTNEFASMPQAAAASIQTAATPNEISVTFYDTEENQPNLNEEDVIELSQDENRPRLRAIFSRCFESTYVPQEPSSTSQVYVPNSDSED